MFQNKEKPQQFLLLPLADRAERWANRWAERRANRWAERRANGGLAGGLTGWPAGGLAGECRQTADHTQVFFR